MLTDWFFRLANYFPNLNTVSMIEVTLTVLALTIRLKAVEITPAEWHVKQWVTLSVCDLIPCPVHCRLHSSYSPESPSLPTWEPLLTYAVGKRWHFFPRLQQKLCTKELTWEPTEREEVKVSDLLLSWLKYCSWHLFSVTAKPKWGSWKSYKTITEVAIFWSKFFYHFYSFTMQKSSESYENIGLQ